MKQMKSHVWVVGLNLFEQFFILFQEFSSFWLFQENDTGWLFGLSGNTEFESASNENVWDFKVFAENGDVTDNING